MTKEQKLLKRFSRRPTDFTFRELKTVLRRLGYVEQVKGKTAGSRIAFMHLGLKHIIRLHKPHPGSILKMYQMNMIVDELIEWGHIS